MEPIASEMQVALAKGLLVSCLLPSLGKAHASRIQLGHLISRYPEGDFRPGRQVMPYLASKMEGAADLLKHLPGGLAIKAVEKITIEIIENRYGDDRRNR